MLAREGESLNDRLRTIIDAFRATPPREALRVASPALASALEHTARIDEDPARVGLALMRYVERMRGRATPFGLCAGYSVGRMSKETSPLTLEPVAKYRKIARLDVDVVSSVVKKRAQEQASDQEELIATRELLRLPNTLRLARRGADGDVAYEDIARSATLDLVLEAAKEPRTRTELLAVLEPFGEEADGFSAVQRQVARLKHFKPPCPACEHVVPALEPALQRQACRGIAQQVDGIRRLVAHA